MRVVEEEVYEGLLQEDADEEDLIADMTNRDSYRKRIVTLNIRCGTLGDSLKTPAINTLSPSYVDDDNRSRTGTDIASYVYTGKRTFRLPIIEFKKFDGDVKEWLSFWGQFKKIHEDPDIDVHDKIEYLVQATVPASRARRVVESFPAVGENYPKIIDSLTSRFGREDIQIEVYVRELLKLILCNATSPNKMDLSLLYDRLETQLRALDTLGITSDKCAAMLFPLIESCLPQELLRAWQRSNFSNIEASTEVEEDTGPGESNLEKRLRGLMMFLKSEVENEQRITLAVEGFGLGSDGSFSRTDAQQIHLSTAAALVNCDAASCVFCGGSHLSENCFKAQKLSLDEKKSALIQKKACLRCLRTGHVAKKCRARLKCLICSKSHVALMCFELPAHKQARPEPKVRSTVGNEAPTTVSSAFANQASSNVFLQTLRAQLKGEGVTRSVRVLIDSGSQRSYVTESTARLINLKPKSREKIIHCLFGGAEAERKHGCYDVVLGTSDYSCTFEALDQPVICSDVSPIFRGPWSEELKSLGIELSDVGDSSPIEVLLGADVAAKIYTGRQRILSCGLIAIETFFGWTLMGQVPMKSTGRNVSMTVMTLLVKDANVTALWELDILGIAEPAEKKSRQQMALAAKELFLDTVTRDSEGRYEVRLPWLEGHPPLLTNYNLAQKRLKTTMNKLEKSDMVEAYDTIFREWLAEGIIEEVPKPEGQVQGHFLPHRPVIKENSETTRIRPVFDASAHEEGRPSLNCCLEKGPNLIEFIPSILLKFREYKIGVVSDIRKAFLQISVSERDRDFLRFLWKTSDGEEIIFRHRRVVFGVSSSPFLLGATIGYHLSESLKSCDVTESRYTKETVEKLARSFYVDNCVTSVKDEFSLNQFMREASMVMAEAKFDLRGWEFTNHAAEAVPKISVLGLLWEPREDVLEINPNCLRIEPPDISSHKITKRFILSTTQRIYDTIGFTAPTTLVPKLLLQKLWQSKVTWDTPLEGDIIEVFCEWLRELPCLAEIKIPRWVAIEPENPQQRSVHVFCDASRTAYAAVIFLRVEHEGKIKVNLLAARARVAPLKGMTIPRLELLAASIAARLYTEVKESLESRVDCYFWSDSSTVLSWIRRTEEWATFVWNRVEEIKKLTPKEAWRHIPGNLNPADLPSRGCSPKQLLQSKWWEGPQWLYQEKEQWPPGKLECNEEEVYQEVKKKLVKSLLNCSPSDIWHLNYFSKFCKTVRMMAWILRFLNNIRNTNQRRSDEELTGSEVESAEKVVLSIIQKESFTGVDDPRIKGLSPFKDEDQLIRLKSRVCNRKDSKNFRFPIIIPGDHSVIKNLIFDQHRFSCHVGAQGLSCLLRENYWVLGGRRAIVIVIRKCVTCKKQNSKPFAVSSPPLPLNRVRDASVFEVTGIDFAGPLYLRDGTKAWITLFTCGVYRAVHLELTTSLSTNSFLQVLRRFVARRGRPKYIYSDNGTNFVGADNAFAKLDWTAIVQATSINRIEWRFNPPTASWWGGFWERLIGIVKSLLKKTLGLASLDYEELLTLLCDCEAIVNARPLTYMSEDSNELVALTPAMFLQEQAEIGTPDLDQVDQESLCRRMQFKQRLREELRRRFRTEYLGQLKLVSSKATSRPISVGEVVLIGHDNEKRLDWPMGRVVEIIKGRDGQSRVVKVDTQRGQLMRPVQRLYPLECLTIDVSEDPPDDPVEAVAGNNSDTGIGSAGVPDVHDVKSRVPEGDASVGSAGVTDVHDVKSRVPEGDSHVRVQTPSNQVKVTRSGRESRMPGRFL